MLYPGEESYRAFQRAAITEANYLKSKGLRDMWFWPVTDGLPSGMEDYRPELLEEQEFVLTEITRTGADPSAFFPDGEDTQAPEEPEEEEFDEEASFA